MLQKSNCCVEVVKEVWRSSFSDKDVLKKSLNMPEEKSPFEKKKKIPNQTRDYC